MVEMNCSRIVNQSQLITVNNEYASMMIPYLVYISVVMVLGIAGNAIVLLVYGTKAKKITLNYFVITLAIFDLLTCIVSFPFNILRTAMQFTFPSEVFCKIGFLSLYMTVSAASFILICIAVHRYNKVCRPLKRGFDDKMAKRLCYASFPVGLCVAVPTALIFGLATRRDKKTGICGRECFIKDEYERTATLIVFFVILCIIFIGLVVTVSVLYILVGKVAYIRRNNRNQQNQIQLRRYQLTTSADALDGSNPDVRAASNGTRNSLHPAVDVDGRENNDNQFLDLSRERSQDSKRSAASEAPSEYKSWNSRLILFKTERMLLAVTVTFILCWLPFWVFISGTVLNGNFLQPETPFQHIIRKVFYEAFYFNNAINPVIYAFMNSAFRDDFRRLSIQWCRRPPRV
ncbi:gastrin/cholecystokinin type B receptor-like [Tubulanus polymorphus]|uniref:gastrin/cholecystokinin type B receptor-like n=1 Tax=Tubulanus polymorphus TaxID=672921 RepID=UPI003DA1E067